jgi:predicted RNA-binding protein associated with RNAse of E/G family
MTWRRGDVVVLREVWHGRIWAARPLFVVHDRPDERSFYGFPGSRWMGPVDDQGQLMRLPVAQWHLAEHPWEEDDGILSFAWPDVPYAVLGYWKQGHFAGWYVNLQDPLRRTAVGFDTRDHVLDVLVPTDGSGWRWKDEDELAEAVRLGLYSAEEAARFRDAGEAAVRRILEGEPPFDREWGGWRPDPAWGPLGLPPGWDEVGSRSL